VRWGVLLVLSRRGLPVLLRGVAVEAPGVAHLTIAGWKRPDEIPAVTRAMPLALGLALRWGGVLDPDGWDRARRVYVEGDRSGAPITGAWDFDPDDRALLGVGNALRARGLVERVEVFDRAPRG